MDRAKQISLIFCLKQSNLACVKFQWTYHRFVRICYQSVAFFQLHGGRIAHCSRTAFGANGRLVHVCRRSDSLSSKRKHQVAQDGATIRRMELDGSLFELEGKELKGQIHDGENYFGERRDELCPCSQNINTALRTYSPR